MRLKLDENLGGLIADTIRQSGHDVIPVHEQGMRGAPDHSVIEICRQEGRCLVTLDLEFGNPLIFRPSRYHGIAVLRLPGGPTPSDLTDGVGTLIVSLQRDSIEGKLWVVQRGLIRQYQERDEDDASSTVTFPSSGVYPPRLTTLGRTGHSVPAADLSGMSVGRGRAVYLNTDEFSALTSAKCSPWDVVTDVFLSPGVAKHKVRWQLTLILTAGESTEPS